MYALSLPVTAFLTFTFSKGMAKLQIPPRPEDPYSLFRVALGANFVVSFLAMSRFAVNQFGYVNAGFRRFLLLPIDPASSLLAGSRACLLVGGSLIPPALALWLIFAGPFDPGKFIMLLASALMGHFAQHAAALWVTLSAGNDLSVMANVVVTGGTAFAPQVLARFFPSAIALENCWGAGVAFAVYVLSLNATGKRFMRKREALLAVLEGTVK